MKKEAISCCDAVALSTRMVQSVQRSEIIPVGKGHRTTRAINPLTGDPYFFIFVDNTTHSLGTYESPYPTLAQAQNDTKPHDVIYIFPGDQTTTGMASGITLKDNQRLWG